MEEFSNPVYVLGLFLTVILTLVNISRSDGNTSSLSALSDLYNKIKKESDHLIEKTKDQGSLIENQRITIVKLNATIESQQNRIEILEHSIVSVGNNLESAKESFLQIQKTNEILQKTFDSLRDIVDQKESVIVEIKQQLETQKKQIERLKSLLDQNDIDYTGIM